MAGVKFDDAELAEIKLKLIKVAAGLSEVAGGAYVTKNMFLESTDSRTAEAMNTLLDSLVSCTETMYGYCSKMVAYFQSVIDTLDQWDYDMAVRSYMLGVQNTVTPDVATRGGAPQPPQDKSSYDQDAYQQGLDQGYENQIPNLPK